MSVESGLVLFFAGTAVLMDFLMEKVVNSFICLGFMAGLICQIIKNGYGGVFSFAAGMIIPFMLLLPLFYFRMLGAGDIKLFSVLGGILGYQAALKIMVCSFFLGGALSLAFLISCGNLRERISYFFNYLYTYYETGQVRSYKQKGKCVENFHFTVPVFLGVVLYAGGFY